MTTGCFDTSSGWTSFIIRWKAKDCSVISFFWVTLCRSTFIPCQKNLICWKMLTIMLEKMLTIPEDNPIGIIWYTWCCLIYILEHNNKIDKVDTLKDSFSRVNTLNLLHYNLGRYVLWHNRRRIDWNYQGLRLHHKNESILLYDFPNWAKSDSLIQI